MSMIVYEYLWDITWFVHAHAAFEQPSTHTTEPAFMPFPLVECCYPYKDSANLSCWSIIIQLVVSSKVHYNGFV